MTTTTTTTTKTAATITTETTTTTSGGNSDAMSFALPPADLSHPFLDASSTLFY